MKTKQNFLLFPQILLIILLLMLSACSTEDQPQNAVESVDLVYENQQMGPHLNTVEEQLAFLKIRMRRYHNLQVAHAQGWNVEGPTIPFMGVHWLNLSLFDETFEMLNPEVLVYAPDENGDMQFVAVEYIHTGLEANGPPEGFIGEEDVWYYLEGVGWTLHAWVGLENPEGVFNPTNPLVILP